MPDDRIEGRFTTPVSDLSGRRQELELSVPPGSEGQDLPHPGEKVEAGVMAPPPLPPSVVKDVVEQLGGIEGMVEAYRHGIEAMGTEGPPVSLGEWFDAVAHTLVGGSITHGATQKAVGAAAKAVKGEGRVEQSVEAAETVLPQAEELAKAGNVPSREAFKLASSPEAKPLRDFLEQHPELVDKLSGAIKRKGKAIGKAGEAVEKVEGLALDEAGKINTALAMALARAGLGAATGAYLGETHEDKVRNVLIGMGLGAVLGVVSPALFKKVADLARRGPVREPGESLAAKRVNVGVAAFKDAVDTPLTFGRHELGVRWSALEDPDMLDKVWRKLINLNKEAIEDISKGGVRSQAEREEMGRALRMTPEDLASREFGAGVTDAEISAATNIVADAAATITKTLEVLDGLPPGSDAWQVVNKELTRQIGIATVLAAKASNMGTVAGRALQAFKDRYEYQAVKEVLTALRSGALPAQTVARQLADLNTPQKANMLTWLANYGPSLASSYYVSSLLFTGKAWVVKLASEIQMAAFMDSEALMQGAFDYVKGLPPYERVYAAELYHGLAAEVHAWQEALGAAVQHLKDGTSMPLATGGKMTAFDMAAPSSPFPKAIATLGNVINVPSRPLGADTAMMRVFAFRKELAKLAARDAYDQLGSGAIKRGDWQRVFNGHMAKPPAWMMAKAKEAAEIATFTDDTVGIVKKLQEVAQDHPSVRFMIPFYKIGTNLARAGWERTPGLGLLARRNREMMGTASGRSLVAAKQINGAMGCLAMWELSRAGRVKGRGPVNANVKRESDVDIPPYSVRVGGDEKGGGEWIGFDRISEPLRTPLGWCADLIAIAAEADPNEWGQAVEAAVMAFGENFSSKTFLADTNEFFKAVMSNNPGALKAMQKVGEGIATSFFPFSPVTQQVRRVTDPIKRETPGATSPGTNPVYKEVSRLIERLQDRTPGYSKRLWPRVRFDGEDGIYDPFWGQGLVRLLGVVSPIIAKEHRPDAVRQEIVKHGISMSLPPSIIFGHKEPPLGEPDWTLGIDLNQNPGWTYVYRKLAGNKLKIPGAVLAEIQDELGQQVFEGVDLDSDKYYGMWDTLHELIKGDTYKRSSPGPHGGKSMRVSRIARAFREAARDVLLTGIRERDLKIEGLDKRPSSWSPTEGDALLRQLLSEKELDKAGALGGEQVRQELEQQLRDRGMMK